MSTYHPPLRPELPTATEVAAAEGAVLVLDPLICFAGLPHGTEILRAENAIAFEYPDGTAEAGQFVLTSTAGSGLTLNRTNAINGRPSIDTSVSGAATQKLCVTGQSWVKGDDVGGLPMWNANVGATAWTMIFLVQMITAGPAGKYSGGWMIGKTATGSSVVLGFATDGAGHPTGFWLGTPGGGELGGAYFDWPDAPPTGLMAVSVSYDGSRLRVSIGGAAETVSAEGWVEAVNIATPGFGFQPAFSGHGPPTSRNYWAAFFPHCLSRRAIRSVVTALARDFSLNDRPLLLVTGDSIASGLELSDIAAWAGDTNYAPPDITRNGGKLYACISPGVSASSGGPTGTAASIVDGGATWAYLGSNREYPSRAPFLNRAAAVCLANGGRVRLLNHGQGGKPTSWFLGPGFEFFVEKYVITSGRTVCVIQTGTNDLAAGGLTAAQVIANRIRLAKAALRAGCRVVIFTSIIPNAGLNPTQEGYRLAINAYGVSDYAALLPAGAQVDAIDFTPIEADITWADDPEVHPDQDGHDLMGDYSAITLARWLV